MSEAEQAILSEFSHDVFDAAVRAGYIVPPWRPNHEAYVLLHEYLIFGFDANQTVEAIFATRQ